MTSVMFAPYAHGFVPCILKFTKELHATSRFNKDIPEHSPLIYAPHTRDILPPCEPLVNGLDSLHKVFAWHFRAILLQQDQSFEMYKPLLSLPDPVDLLSVTKIIQYLASAINADEG